MLFTESRFLVFFVIVFLVYWALNKNTPRKHWLLLSSYVFYGSWDWRFLSLIILSTLINYLAGLRMSNPAASTQRRKQWLIISLVANLGILGFFKYFNFFAESATEFLGLLGLQANWVTLHIVLPVGISFFTFQAMSYTIDVYRNKLAPQKNLFDLALFIAFFPQLVAGPIVRAADFLPQLAIARSFSQVNVRACLVLFMIGFFKKACVADNLAPLIDQYFANPELYTVFSAWLAVLCYAIQIYCDFSGYSDMAIACAGLLGYQLCLNFAHPYFAANITDFWRRWHISLSSWLRDYLYIPLGGNRGNQWFTYRNLMLTMLLGGLWHGAAWNFVIWGGLHGLALILHREWSKWLGHLKFFGVLFSLIGPLLTFYWVCIAWVFFRASDLATALHVNQAFILFESSGTQTITAQLLGLIIILAIVHWLAYRRVFNDWWQNLSGHTFAVSYGVAAALLMTLLPTGYTPFIYFQF